MLKGKYFQELQALLKRIETEQGEAINKAAAIISDAIAEGRAIHIYDTGHMLDSELIGRAGGLMCFKRLRVDFTVRNEVRNRSEDENKDRNMEGFMRYVLKQSKALPGDVLIVGSVSGKSVPPVDIALCAKEMGLKVIALTSIAYSSILESMHSSKKRLFEVADMYIDNCAPPEDAMIEVPGNVSICPASGISAAAIMWAVTAQVVENLMARGIKPTIYKSSNYPGNDKNHNNPEYERYKETGF